MSGPEVEVIGELKFYPGGKFSYLGSFTHSDPGPTFYSVTGEFKPDLPKPDELTFNDVKITAYSREELEGRFNFTGVVGRDGIGMVFIPPEGATLDKVLKEPLPYEVRIYGFLIGKITHEPPK